ncbi:MAG: 3-deoxy-manno-octulosonate cytidylyltransferase [Kiritimatiellae bacterium]|nr:3-deoxy-manno-octulosonate cytidylyltransferase [Kiritimatiellia bacterium]
MQTIGVIPSRWGSTRFPGKSLFPLCGKPLVRWVVEAVKRARALDRVIVATDDERIAKAVEDLCETAMTDPDLPSGTDRVAVAAKPQPDDVVINIQGDEPLISPALIDALAERMREQPFEMATAVTPIRSMADLQARTVVKVVLTQNDEALYFSRLPIPCRRDGEADLASGLYFRHLGIYAYRGAFLSRLVQTPPCPLEQTEKLEQLRALYIGAKIAVIRTEEPGVGVDTPADAAAMEKLLQERGAV